MTKDITGNRYGKLTVIQNAGVDKHRHIQWLCQCDCGNQAVITTSQLTKGTKSCGCLKIQVLKARATHKYSGSKTYASWTTMKQRCTNPNTEYYDNYGGKGITICDRWLTFENFLADMGEKPKGSTLDRIENDKGYYKDNCRWASTDTQNNNRTNVHLISYHGETKTITDWSRLRGIPRKTLYARLFSYHWTPEKALEEGVAL